jgi:hypothetical protein
MAAMPRNPYIREVLASEHPVQWHESYICPFGVPGGYERDLGVRHLRPKM